MRLGIASLVLAGAVVSLAAQAAEDDEQLAKELANPIANLISVPFQANYDCCFGPSDADKYTLNIQPVIPIEINDDWNLILRTIVPVAHLNSVAPGVGSATGLGDTLQSFFFSPQQPTSNGVIWGAGPVFLYPTATDVSLGSGQWGAGPTAVALKQSGPWTVGALANHVWSFAQIRSNPTDVNSTFIQPFIGYTTPSAFTVTLNSESTYDWVQHRWTVPVNLLFSQVVMIGRQPVSFQAGPRAYISRPGGGPDWGVRFNVTLLFPAK